MNRAPLADKELTKHLQSICHKA